jgi:hypothetical protein
VLTQIERFGKCSWPVRVYYVATLPSGEVVRVRALYDSGEPDCVGRTAPLAQVQKVWDLDGEELLLSEYNQGWLEAGCLASCEAAYQALG